MVDQISRPDGCLQEGEQVAAKTVCFVEKVYQCAEIRYKKYAESRIGFLHLLFVTFCHSARSFRVMFSAYSYAALKQGIFMERNERHYPAEIN
jgi:hypothetical protein